MSIPFMPPASEPGSIAGPGADELSLGRREIALIAAFWLLFALVTVANRLLDPRRPVPVSVVLPADTMLALAQSALWALLTVPLFQLAARAGDDRGTRAVQVVSLVLAGALAALVASAVMDVVRAAVFPSFFWRGGGRGPASGPPRGGGSPFRIGGIQFLNDVVIALGVIAAGLARAYSLRYRARQAQAVRLHAQLAEARLDALRRQLDPHFLFNTLHAVSSLVERDPRGVRRMITRLSELLRHSIEGAGAPEVPLRQELELLRRYLEIMQVRFQGRLEVETKVDDATLDALVPNMILQPLVENAIKHGVEKLTGPGRIDVEASYDDGMVVLRVRDNGPGPDAGGGVVPPPGGRAGGLGLANTVARLEQLYGAEQRFTLRPAADGGTVAEVRLPLHTRTDLHVAGVPAGAGGTHG